MTVHILAPDDHPFSLNRLTAKIGFLALGEDVQMFDENSFDDIPLGEQDIVVGGIGFARGAMKKLKLEVAELDSIPETVMDFAGRKVWQSTMGELRQRVNDGEAIFAKPRPDRTKAFVGRVYAEYKDLITTAHIDDDEPIDCAQPLEFKSEHRCFVMRGDPIGLRHYTGDPLALPDTAIIRNAIASYTDGPMGYAMDFAVTPEGKTLVVEVNDGYAIGAYGLPPLQYANLIKARWDEIKRDCKS